MLRLIIDKRTFIVFQINNVNIEDEINVNNIIDAENIKEYVKFVLLQLFCFIYYC